MLEARVKKSFANFVLNADLKDEGIISITGPNGSGKSTFLNIIAGFIKQDDGRVIIAGRDVSFFPPEKRGVVLVTPDSYIPSLDVSKHLRFGAKLAGYRIGETELSDIRKMFQITFDGKMRNLSLGQRERVSIVTALLSKPSLLLVDESFSNISDSKDFIKNLLEFIENYHRMDLIFTTQDLEMTKYAQHHYMMRDGSLLKRF
ncbi:ABC transporter ATP-binding protein [Metallosphaera tengchongensis]|uniref:Molybdate/tungstate import ATP-binding protein WtpC n=1 Tax=Metallosphaera tengchongensis TaxID=1532350 RepID=A0A6N0NVY1_9CREN|nr:ATPase, T2SS/T4P/T4SS family [Metallosphaera tengchongensis]QKQ99290.1 ABC transporter ATP-binding protein [Metallosphaera tengchongensis]